MLVCNPLFSRGFISIPMKIPTILYKACNALTKLHVDEVFFTMLFTHAL